MIKDASAKVYISLDNKPNKPLLEKLLILGNSLDLLYSILTLTKVEIFHVLKAEAMIKPHW